MKPRLRWKKEEVALLVLPVVLLVALGGRFRQREEGIHSAFMKKVRLDGLYVAEATVLPGGWEEHQYVRFYKDGTVTAASCDTPWLKYVAQKLNGYHHANYAIEHEEIRFSVLWPQYNNGQVDYVGRFEGQELVLHRTDYMKNAEFVTRYKFVPLYKNTIASRYR